MVTKKDLRMEYRKSNIDPSYIIESVILETRTSVKKNLIETTQSIKQKRIKSQPIFEKTCGSTFKNPSNLKAWELINGSGCAGMSWGGAFVSPKHCNFLINDGSATSFDFLNLINAIREKVQEETGVMLELEIIII
jgi:UDP-N-acetylmuramate dehydrogenase